MVKEVFEEHRELFHYTTGVGLRGIIETQQLWATSIAYLNDVEEHVGFFDRRLLTLLDQPTREAVAEISKRPEAKQKIEESGGADSMVAGMKEELRVSMRRVSLNLNEPYIAAFCSAGLHGEVNDGLLSQWRGYGPDGGYAIGFLTEPLERMLRSEVFSFAYQFGSFGDVHYGDASLPERSEWERQVQEYVLEFLLTEDPRARAKMYGAITGLSCLYKHHGFQEEAEVRIVVVPTHRDVHEHESRTGKPKPQKPILFRVRNGTLVPYMALFGAAKPGDSVVKLPISKIIVGPHREKLERAKAVELLLKNAQLDAQVVVSDIPYVGA